MPKIVLHGAEARAALLRGVDFLAKAVKVTLGPKGRLCVMSRRAIGQSPQVTKDGVTVANHVDPIDPCEQMGSDLIREAAQKTVAAAGDGTTTSVVLAQAIAHAGMKQIDAGVSPADLERGINQAVSAIAEALNKMAIPADDERLLQVATIASNGDSQIATLILQAIKAVGKDGVMACEIGNSLDTTLDVVSGMQLRQGFRSPHFITDPERQECVLTDPLIFLHEGTIGNAKSLRTVLKLAFEMGRPLLCIAGDYERDGLAAFVQNLPQFARVHNQQGIQTCCIRADGWSDRRREILRDIAVLTGGTAITEDLGMKLENFTADKFGKAKRVVVNEFKTTITEGEGDYKQTHVRAEEIRQQIARSEDPTAILMLRQRLSGLAGGVAIVRVGGATESEIRERKDRVEDALFATKAAAEEGIVPGGGFAFLQSLDSATVQLEGNEIVCSAICEPLKVIASNAGKSAEYVLERCLIEKRGFNATTGLYGDMLSMGIVDPLKVVREALINAASVAITILKTDCVIGEIMESKK